MGIHDYFAASWKGLWPFPARRVLPLISEEALTRQLYPLRTRKYYVEGVLVVDRVINRVAVFRNEHRPFETDYHGAILLLANRTDVDDTLSRSRFGFSN